MTAIHERRGQFLNAPVPTDYALDSVAPWERRYARLLLILDTTGVIFSLGLAQWLRFGGPFGGHFDRIGGQIRYDHTFYLVISTIIALCWLWALTVNNSRSPRVIGSGAEEYRRVWLSTIATFGGVAIISMLFELQLARGYVLIALPVGALVLLALRWTARRTLVRVRQLRGGCTTKVLAVGSAGAVRHLSESLLREPRAGYRVVGACITGCTAGVTLDLNVPDAVPIPVFGDESHVVGAVTATGSHAVAVAATDRLHGRGIQELSWELEKLNVGLLVAPGLVDVAGPRLQMRPVAGLPLIQVEKPQYQGAKRMEKRLFDITFAGAVLLIGLPFLVPIAIAIKLTSRGPVFYRQERIGLDGKVFNILKFRTMVEDADSKLDQMTAAGLTASAQCDFKFHNDPRVTRLGRILRKYSIDEVPQFINVLKRDMSVVGPRPQVAKEVQNYDAHARRRLLVRPGITGLWQVSGRSDLSWEDSMRLDLFYVENWSMMADLVIAVKTARAVFGHQGAY